MNKKQKQAINRANKLRISSKSADAYVGELLFEHLGLDDYSCLDLFFIDRGNEGTLYLIIDKNSERIEIPVDILFKDEYKDIGADNLFLKDTITYFN